MSITPAAEARTADPSGSKACSNCKINKPREAFYKNARATDGRASWCKDCTKAGSKRQYDADPAAANAKRVEWGRANKERGQAANAKWAAANPERQRETWRKSKQVRRAARKGILTEYVDPLVLLELDDGLCGVCGSDVDPFEFHMDHIIPVSRGGDHSYVNMQVSHPLCNKRKAASMPWDQTERFLPVGSPRDALEAQVIVQVTPN